MSLELDESLKSHGVLEIKRVGNDIVILISKDDKQEKFTVKIKQNREEFTNILEKKCRKSLGQILCQDMIEFISRDENWTILCPSAESKQSTELQVLAEKYNPKYHFDNFEQWQVAVEDAYHALHKKVDDNMPDAWPGIEFLLSIKAILHIKEITLPYIGIILGRPSGVKSVVLKLLRGRPYTFFTDKFNPPSMVSHASSLPPGMKEGDQHMLNKMKNNAVLAPELASIFTGGYEQVSDIIQLMTRVADGDGLETDSGLGHKGVIGKVMFVMIGAGVEFTPMVYSLFSFFGAKMYCFRLPEVTKTHDQYFEYLKGDLFEVKFPRMKDAMNTYLDIFESCPIAEPEEGLPYYLPKIPLAKFRVNDSDDALHIIVYLGELLKHLRLVTKTYGYNISTKKTTQEGDKTETFETEEMDYSFNTSTIEDQSRADQQHYNLALAHALSMGRTCVGIDDIPLTVKVTLSTAPQNRHKVFDELLDYNGSITTVDIQDNLGLHWNTATKTMTELVAVGLVDMDKTGKEHNNTITLKNEFSWFLGEEFEAVRHDSYRRYHEYLENLNLNLSKNGEKPTQDEA